MNIKKAVTDFPIQPVLTDRWSPFGADPTTLPDALKERDLAPRQRRRLSDFVFAGHWMAASPLVVKRET